MRILTVILGPVLVPFLLFGQNTDETEKLRHLKEVEQPQAYREQDTSLLDRILADEFQMIDADGNTYTKQDEIEFIKTINLDKKD